MKKTQTKQKRCPKGTRKNKEGECVTIVKMQKIQNGRHEKEDWEKKSTNQTIEHGGKKYEVFVIPENTYVYRGFCYGDNPRGRRHAQEIAEIMEGNEEEYLRKKKAGLYYGNLPVAVYYAYNPDYGNRWKHAVVEYKTKQPIKMLDMTVWQNLKNVVDVVPELEECFADTHGFDMEKPQQELIRKSGAWDNEMTEFMVEWLESNLDFDGFGHVAMTGFHSEFVCLNRNKLSEENEYVSDNFTNRQMMNTKYLDVKDIVINLEKLSFKSFIDDKPIQFKVTSLLNC